MHRFLSVSAGLLMFLLGAIFILGLAANEVAAADVLLAWEYGEGETPTNVDGFVMYYQETAGADSPIFNKKLEDPDARQMWVRDLMGNTEYKFWIIAYNEYTSSDSSNVVTGTTAPFVPPDDVQPVIIRIPAPAIITIQTNH